MPLYHVDIYVDIKIVNKSIHVLLTSFLLVRLFRSGSLTAHPLKRVRGISEEMFCLVILFRMKSFTPEIFPIPS